ncbi:Hypothetical predicted protein [Cloeon dipterum]|uniref:Uncharacterized protein n=1 Tax=Cloeon dipterum TaxID=197152 RepID=A0A8S1C4Z9_9INSE|nr:Hypothetical predicted protein [Cloeon dipterum]
MDKLGSFFTTAAVTLMVDGIIKNIWSYFNGDEDGKGEEPIRYRCAVSDCPAQPGNGTLMSIEELSMLSKLCVKHMEPFRGVESFDLPRVCNFCRQLLKTLSEECCMATDQRQSKNNEMDFCLDFSCILCPPNGEANNTPLSKFERKQMLSLCLTHLLEPYCLLAPDAERLVCKNFNYHARRAIKDCCKSTEVYFGCYDVESLSTPLASNSSSSGSGRYFTATLV